MSAAPSQPAQKVVCWFYSNSLCLKGKNCAFSHDVQTVSAPASVEVASHAKTACELYRQGKCADGDKCKFVHDDARLPAVVVKEKTVLWRFLIGAAIRFGSSGSVAGVTLPSDYSVVQVDWMSTPVGRKPISDMFLARGIDIASADISLTITKQAGKGTAVISMRDRTFCERATRAFASQLRSLFTFSKYSLSQDVKVFAGPPPKLPGMPRSPIFTQLSFSWARPTRQVILHYATFADAARVYARFNTGTYTILGFTVTCTELPMSGLVMGLVLHDVVAEADEIEIRLVLAGHHDWPISMSITAPSYALDAPTLSTHLQALLSQFSERPEIHIRKLEDRKRRYRATARFENAGVAREIQEALNGTPQEFLGRTNMYIMLKYIAQEKIPANTYKLLRKQIQNMQSQASWRQDGVTFTVFRMSEELKTFLVHKQDNITVAVDQDTSRSLGYVMFVIEADSPKAVKAAQNALQRVLDGHLLLKRDGTGPLWSPIFEGGIGDKKPSRRIQEMADQFNLNILCNRATRRVHLLGLTAVCVLVSELIQALVEDQPVVKEHIIDLDARSMRWAIQGGHSALVKLLGSEAVSMQLTRTSKIILMRGDKLQYHQALGMVRRLQTASEISIKDHDCTICWSTAENPVTADCGHLYCLGCFEQLCLHGAEDTTDKYTIKCHGYAGKCTNRVQLKLVQQLVSSTVFDQVLHTSLRNYLAKHTDDFHYCPTADCSTIYRVSRINDDSTQTVTDHSHCCHECLNIVCTICHEQHDAKITCGEYAAVAGIGYQALEQWKRDNNAKQCPRCKSSLQKDAGCNHLMCPCGTHVCWVCSEGFTSSKDCYGHLREEHGSFV